MTCNDPVNKEIMSNRSAVLPHYSYVFFYVGSLPASSGHSIASDWHFVFPESAEEGEKSKNLGVGVARI